MRTAEVSIKARSPSALLAVIGQVSKHTTVKWHWHIILLQNKKEKLLLFSEIITVLNYTVGKKANKQKY